MTDIEKQALALVREVGGLDIDDLDADAMFVDVRDALFRAIERHEVFKQEVSDALREWGVVEDGMKLSRFILPEPVDPLVEAMHDCGVDRFESWADQLRAALAARGLEIREVE